ncbi:MAG: hypothetical protein E7434_08385, partial [Ruminococcaceae bacterium]|nr:hypothetical protein [Oscillospiraceae bacterium]
MNINMKWQYRFLAFILILSMLPVSPLLQVTATASTRAVVSGASISVPAYSGGTASGWMTYDCGVSATYGSTGSESRMQIVTGTTAAQFKAYCAELDSNSDYTKIYSNTVEAQIGNNFYAKYLANDGTHSLYTYFTAAYNQTRIIVDTQRESFRTYSYDATGDYRTEFYMYGLSNSEDGFSPSDGAISWQNRSTGGALLIMRMADNSLFIIDGGGYDQMSDRSAENLYAFLRRITGTDENQKMLINTWFITHPHVDHCAGLARFLHKYSEHFDMLNIMYNFDVLSASASHIQRVARLYPDAKYYKQHTGESFTVCDVKFDVLYTVEDRYFPNTNNELIKGDSTCMDNTNENNISTVLRVTMGDKKLILTGDIGNADTILMKMYPSSALKGDILQLPHHGYDNHTNLAITVAPTISILNQSGEAISNKKNIHNFDAAWAPFAGTIYYGGSHTIGYAAETGIFLQESVDDVDFLQWDAKSYELSEADPYAGGSKVYAPETYYRYSKINRLADTEKAYLIADKKLNRILSYDATDGTADSALSGLFDGTHWYIADQDRHAVNWLIYGTKTAQPHANSPVSDAEITYYNDLTITKGTGDYWSDGTNPTGMVLGNGDTFTSTGMYNSWCSVTEELETASKWTWIDALPDDSFLIYRHTGGTYYSLYREGNVADNGGWGVTKMTSKSDVSKNINYLKTELYLYEETASKMYVTWTGHKNYTCYTGIPENNIISLLSADIRVKWAFDGFDGSGEAYHTSLGRKNPGEYWFEFSSAYNSSVAKDYTVTIKYKTANGTIMDIGTFTLHVKNRSSEELGHKELFFDFGNTTEDRYKYKTEDQYKEINFDGTSRWVYSEQIASANTTTEIFGEVNTEDGTLSVKKATATNQSNTIFVDAYAKGSTPLSFDPQYAEVVQLRLKLDNLKAAGSLNPSFRLWYYAADGSRAYDAAYSFGTNYTSDGEYMILCVKLSTMNTLTKVTGIGMGFHDFTLADSAKEGTVTVDYIYIGPEDGIAARHSYESIVTLPTCSTRGYTTHLCKFCGESYIDTDTDKDSSNHTYAGKVSKSPTLYATGTLKLTCGACGATATRSLPKLNASDYTGRVITAATCTQAGSDSYLWNTTDYGEFSFTAASEPLGHSYDSGVVTKYPTLSATGVITYTCHADSTHTYTETAQKLHESFYVGFENTTVDQARYNNTVYGFRNFDLPGYWSANNNGTSLGSVTVDHDNGKLTVRPGITGSTLVIQPSESSTATPVSPLYLDPANAEVIQFRMKFENVTCVDGKNPLVAADPYAGSSKLDTEDYIFTQEQVEGGEYFTVTVGLTDAHRAKGTFTKFRLYFTNMSFTPSSKVVLDYIYIGAEGELPKDWYTVTFKDEDGTVLQSGSVYKGSNAVYNGKTPAKAADATNHYSFKGWDKALSNISADTTITATYTATAHSYSYTNADTTNHKASCSCGYSKTEAHSYSYKLTASPTLAATGTLTGTCSHCSTTTTVTLPKLNATDYTKSTSKTVTCTEAGIDTYKWNTTTYGSYSFTVTAEALGHSYDDGVVTTIPTLTEEGVILYTCQRDPSHTYEAAAEPLRESLYMDFENTAADQERYNNYAYGFRNFDTFEHWVAEDGAYDTIENGTLILQPATAGTTLKIRASEDNITQGKPLYFDPAKADTIQLKMKFEAVGYIEGKTPIVSVDTYAGSTKVDLPDQILTQDEVVGGEYFLVTIPISAENQAKGIITNIRLYLGGMSFSTSSKAIIDYVYVGSGENLPSMQYTVTFKDEDGTVLQTGLVNKGEDAIYTGEAPTKIYDGTNHYTFRAWDTALTNITADTIITATYTATAHSYTYRMADEAVHNASCACGYSKTISHSWDSGVIDPKPTLEAAGSKTITCSVCNGTKTETVEKLSQSLYMGFENTAADQERYNNYAYGFRNFDTFGHWVAEDGAYDTIEDGTLILQPKTAATTLKVRASEDDITQGKPLYFDPAKAEFIQLKMKFEGVSCLEGKTAFVSLDPYVGSTKIDLPDQTLSQNQVLGEEFIVTIPISAENRTKGIITNIRLYLGAMSFSTSSRAMIEYIYVGSEEKLPTPRYTVTFQNADGTVLQTGLVYKGETAVYTGEAPAKTYDTANHYAFRGWDTALTNITADTTITATYTATAHSYTYSKADDSNHNATCSCGYSKTLSHSWNSGSVTTQPTCTATGVKTFTCSVCKGTKTETVSATGHTEVIDKAVAPTCTETGLTEGKHCSVCDTIIVKQNVVAALGHSYKAVVTDPTCTTGGYTIFTCSVCSDSYRGNEVAANGHVEVIDKAVAPT